MSTIVGDMEIRLRADIARLQANMDDARRVVGGSMDRIGRMAGQAKAALGAIAGVLSVAAFATWIQGAIDAADAAGKFSDKTGVAVKDVAGLQMSFELGGVSAEKMVKSMSKLSKEIVDQNKVFETLGIKTKDAQGYFLSTRDVLHAVADEFAEMENGALKTAKAVAIFGETGVDLIPMLNGGSAALREMDEMAKKLGLTMSAETAAKAGEFNDTLDLLKTGSQGVARGVAAELLPTLTSLSGAFLTSMTEGNKLSRTAEVIGTALKGLYTVGVIVAEVFNTVGSVVAGVVAQVTTRIDGFFAVVDKIRAGEFSAAMDQVTENTRQQSALMNDIGQDLANGWQSSMKSISAAWSGEGDAAVAAMAKTAKAQQDLLAAQDKRDAAALKAKQVSDAARKAQEAYIAGIQKEVAELGLSATAIKLREGALLGLAPAELRAAAAALAKRDAYIEEKKRADELKKVNEKAIADSDAIVAGIGEETRTIREKIKTYGLLPEAITRGKIAELEASKQSVNLTEANIADIQRRIDALGELAAAQGSSARQDIEKKAIEDNIKAQASMWESIESTAHDTFVSIFDSGKSAFDRLRDTLKNGLLDLLYQMTVKKWIFSISASVTGGASGMAQAAGMPGVGGMDLSSISGVAAAAKTAYAAISSGFSGISTAVADGVQGALYQSGATTQIASNGAFAQGAGTVAGYAAGAAVGVYGGRAVSNGYAISGSGNGVVNAGTAIGAIVGGPIGAAIGGLIGGAANRLFGRRPRQTEDTWLNGSFNASGNFQGGTDDWWREKGGVLRSDKSGVTKTALGSSEAQSLTDGYQALKAASADFATSLGLSAESIKNRSQSMVFRLTNDQAANEALFVKFFTDVGDTIAKELVPDIAAFAKAGESAGATLQRIAEGYAFVDAALEAMGTTFKSVGIGSLKARENLVDLVGGLDSLGKGAAFFAANFMSESERLAPVAIRLKASLAEMGLAFVDTREEFKAVVMGLDASDADDAKTLAGLFKIQEQFAQLYPATEAATDAMSAAREAQDAMRASLEDVIGSMTSFGASTRNLKNDLLTGSLSTLTPEQQYAETRRQLQATVAAVKGGDAAAQGQYSSAVTAFLSASRTVNASNSTYSADFAGVLQTTDELSQWAAGQVDVAQSSLNALNAQVAGIGQLNATMLEVAQGVSSLPAAIISPPPDQGASPMAALLSEVTALRVSNQALTTEVQGLRKDQMHQTEDLMRNATKSAADAADEMVRGTSGAERAKRWEIESEAKLV
jgi:hypothetical protein